MDALSTKEVAERLSVHPNTIALWEEKIGIQPQIDSRGRKKFPPETVGVLEQIKALRAEDAGYQTIRRRLCVDDGPHIPAPVATQPDSDRPAVPHSPSMSHPSPELMKMLEIMEAKDRHIAQLQEQLRDVASIAAQFQERSTNLASEIHRQKDEIKLLMAPAEPISEPSRAWSWPWAKR